MEKLETPEQLMHEFNERYYVTKLAPEMREVFIRAVKCKLDLLFGAIETAREHGIYPSVIITSHGRPTLQVEE